MPDPQPNPEDEVHLIVEPAQLAGSYANMARVTFSDHEFTLDFVRLDHGPERPKRGIIVSRVAISPTVAAQVADLLGRQVQEYARRVIERETDST